MLKSYIKIALRSFKKNKLISFINIFGLCLSMSIGMMIMIRLQDQLNYDSFHPYPDRTYRVISEFTKKSGERWKMASTSLPLSDDFGDGVEASTVIYPAFKGKATAAGKEIYVNGAFTNSSFFKVFGFSLKEGNMATVLDQPNTVMITKKTAEKFFGNSNPVGKLLTMENGQDYMITGLLNEEKDKSHIQYDAFASMASVTQLEKQNQLPLLSGNRFAMNSGYTYVLLKNGYSRNKFQTQLNSIASELTTLNREGSIAFTTQGIGKITPGNDYLANDNSGSSWTKFYFEIGVAILILLAACFNYTNITIARALTRAKEVGIRKVSGAKRGEIFLQYIIESVILAFISLAFAWLILSLIVRYAPFNDGYEFIPSSFHYNTSLFIWSLVFALFTGLLAGSSPAWILSSFKPLRVLKNLGTAKIMGKVSLQKTLIVFQYSLSLIIIIFLISFYRQFSYMATTDPGFKKDNVLIVPLNKQDSRLVAEKINSLSGVTNVGFMSASLAKRFGGVNTPAWIDSRQASIALNYYYADPNFIRGMQLRVLAGNNFTSTDGENLDRILINEQASKALGFRDIQQAIGRSVWFNDSLKLQIAGVLKDFMYENAGAPIKPLAFRTGENVYNYLYLSTGNVDKKPFEARVNEAVKALDPSQTVTSAWMDEELSRNYSQTATISLLGYLAFICVGIASLGLLSLVIYTVQVKRKEISIRKIVGADERQLVYMLSIKFLKLLFIAGCIAVPLGYTAGVLFLQNFPIRASFGLIWPFLCFLFLFVIGLLTIIPQTYKAATVNPGKDLRME